MPGWELLHPAIRMQDLPCRSATARNRPDLHRYTTAANPRFESADLPALSVRLGTQIRWPLRTITSNALMTCAPLVAGIEDPEERRKLVNGVIYPISRALVGHRLADELLFPASRSPFTRRWGVSRWRLIKCSRRRDERGRNLSTYPTYPAIVILSWTDLGACRGSDQDSRHSRSCPADSIRILARRRGFSSGLA